MPEPRQLAAWAEEHTNYVALLESGGGSSEKARYTLVAYGARRIVEETNPVEAYQALRRITSATCTSIPCRRMLFGVVGYEAVAAVEPWLVDMLKKHTWPVTAAFEPEVVVVYDNALGHATVCPGDAEVGGRPIDGWEKAHGPVYETPRRDFEEWVREALELIRRGEFLQIVLSRLERYEYTGNPLALYAKLAESNPSPYMFYVRLGGRWIVGSSPELLLKMENGRLETHPIAGTRPRGRTPEEDLDLEEELLGDEKEQAEHLMLVDLARNDLGRYAVPGTVRVTRFMDIEKYSAVQHIVSRVEAVALPGVDYVTVLAAVNPAGTVSGAPKPRAIETIARLEDEARGPYAGAAGIYAGYAGETAIVIRSIWSIDSGSVETRAGAGIVYDSKPEREYMETKHKLAAIRRALGVESL
jgi:anthranilate synthase component 1